MGISATVEERLESEAEFGLFSAYLKIGLNKAKSLREQGFEVEDLKEVNYFPRLHRITWINSVIENVDTYQLDENSDEYSFSEKLWIISKKNECTKKIQN